MIREVFDIYGTVILVGIFLILFLLEEKFALRQRVQGRWKRIIINFVMSLPAFALLRLLLIPLMVLMATKADAWQFGINHWLQLPVVIQYVLSFVLLDYGNYLWHVLMHKIPLLWRFHLAHHTDLDLDVSTAFRFHFGEMIGSIFFRGAVILLIGPPAILVLIYEIVFEAATQFHHSNMKIPFGFERFLNYFMVTPRMHGIHHSIIKKETDSNYSVILNIWDRLHRTVKLDVAQDEIVVGVAAYQDEQELTIGQLLKLPFTKIRPWPEEERKTTGDKRKLQP